MKIFSLFAVLFALFIVSPAFAYISITQESPLGGLYTYYTKNISVNFTIDTDGTLDKCWRFNDNTFTGFQANISIIDCQNTSFIAYPYVNYFFIWANNTAGEVNCSTYDYDDTCSMADVFSVSPTAVGFINMTSPENTSYELSSDIDLNFTAVFNETGITGYCEYSLDSGSWTGGICDWTGYYNITLTGLLAGPHDVQIRMAVDYSENNNDYMLSPDVFFTLTDLVLPTVAVQSPTGTITSPFDVNYTVWDVNGIDSCWYSVDEGSNVSIPSCANFTDSGSSGDHNLTIYANDTFGNIGSATSPFNVLAPLIPPTANVTGSTAMVYMLLPLLLALLIFLFVFYEVTSGRMNIKDAFALVIIGIIMVIVAAGIVAVSV
jgi:hypothetical protein